MPENFKPDKAMFRLFFVLCLIISGNFVSVSAQTPDDEGGDTLIIESESQETVTDTAGRSPRKAAIYSAALPGLGQIYNEKYWKLPIVYAGFGTLGFFIVRNTRYYNDLKQKLIDPDYELKYFEGDFTEDQISRGKDIYKRYRDLSIISTVGFYVLQIIDATVDAYLFDWDVDEDISVRLEPSSQPYLSPAIPTQSYGLRACISF